MVARWYRRLYAWCDGKPRTSALVDTVVGTWVAVKVFALVAVGLTGGLYLQAGVGWWRLTGVPLVAAAWWGLHRQFA